jgi:hypothetical protein
MGGCTGSIRSKNTTVSADASSATSFENLPRRAALPEISTSANFLFAKRHIL